MEPPDEYHWYYDDRDIEDIYAEESARKKFEDVTVFDSAYTDDEEFDPMWPAVHMICESLRYEAHKWQFFEHRFKNLENGTEYWSHRLEDPVTEIWDCGTVKVFSRRQGEQIFQAMKIAQKYKRVTEPQKKLIEQLGLNKNEIVDIRAGEAIMPKLTFWQRLKYLLNIKVKTL